MIFQTFSIFIVMSFFFNAMDFLQAQICLSTNYYYSFKKITQEIHYKKSAFFIPTRGACGKWIFNKRQNNLQRDLARGFQGKLSLKWSKKF